MNNPQHNPSQWQEKITGDWHGIPSVFDPTGTHIGYNKVSRASIFEGDKTTYIMDTDLRVSGPLQARFEAKDFRFGVVDSDSNRIYTGPDFFGAGHPYGMLVDAHYYSPCWLSDLRTMVHILPDGETQVYSSLLYDGPTICGVFNGVYKRAFDYDSNPETKERIDAFLAQEEKHGRKPHVLPMKDKGHWTGIFEVYDEAGQALGTCDVTVTYKPVTLLSAEVHVQLTGVIEKEYRYLRTRHNMRHSFDGPDVFGNGMSYGRALYTSQHFHGEALKIQGREFIIDQNYTMSVVWRFFASDRAHKMAFGVLTWQPEERVLDATYM